MRKKAKLNALNKQVRQKTTHTIYSWILVGNLKRPKLFWKAVDEAHMWQEVKQNKKTSGSVSAVASRAASLAAAENRKPRCGNCEACLNRLNGGSTFSRRCLYIRAQAAAAAGHVGAQVAIHRDKAIGAKVELYWPLDQKWFPGIVRLFSLSKTHSL